MKTPLLVVLAVLVPCAVLAQTRADETRLVEAAREAALVEKTLSAMTAAGPMGKAAVVRLRAFASIARAKQDEDWRIERGPRTIRFLVVSDAYSDPKSLGPVLAEASERDSVSDMPECAEKERMVRAFAAAVARELKAPEKPVPSVEEIAKKEGKPTLESLIADAQGTLDCYSCRAELKGMAADRKSEYERAAARYAAFLAGNP